MLHTEEKLFTKNFIFITISSFFTAWSLQLILTMYPIFLLEELGVSPTVSGILLALFPFGALVCRPFAGWLADSFPRKKTALVAAFGLIISGVGYFIFRDVFAIGLLRAVQGFLFSVATTTVSAMALDTIPENKLGTGVGLFSTSTSLAMIIGPMSGFILLDLSPDDMAQAFFYIFAFAVISSVSSFLSVIFTSITPKIKPQKTTFSKDKLLLKTGKPVTFSLLTTATLYCMFLNYTALYARELNFASSSSLFFLFMGVGLVLSRMVSGFFYDRGYMVHQTIISFALMMIFSLIFSFTTSLTVFVGIAFGLGLSFGAIIPTFQTLLVEFAQKNERGLASSTYYIAFDIGAALSVFGGGVIIDFFSLQAAYLTTTALQLLWIFVFIFRVIPDYKALKAQKNEVTDSLA